jgi:Amt family ammonium transporter
MHGINPGDTAFVLLSAGLVMLMTPGLALFYGGMVRSKNVLSTIMHSMFILGMASVLWVLCGYSLAFGPDVGGVIGSLSWMGLKGVGQTANAAYAPNIPHLAFMIFQCMFAVITPALISGAFAERMKFSGFVVFTLLWCLLVYCPVAHWVWGVGGWIRNLGAMDFAGGAVVHVNAGVAALAAAIVMGRRKGFGSDTLSPHNLPLTVLGAGILWFGWFGFNAGSALAANGLAANAFVVTNMSAAAGAMAWAIAEWLHRKKPTTLGAVSGCVAGLVAITPACGFVGPLPALIIGALASAICYGGVLAKWRLGYDDSLDVVGIHGLGGALGAILTGVFASKLINPAGMNGLLSGGSLAVLEVQVMSVLVVAIYSFAVSFLLLKLVKATIGLRVSEEDEETGMDLSQHSEVGYAL